jgi:hypothetical protein
MNKKGLKMRYTVCTVQYRTIKDIILIMEFKETCHIYKGKKGWIEVPNYKNSGKCPEHAKAV